MRDDARRPDELINASGIASLLGVVPAAVSNWQSRTDAGTLKPPFPVAWYETGAGNPKGRIALFVRSEIEEWFADRRAVAIARNARNIARLERQLEAARHKSDAIASGPGTVSRFPQERG